MNYVYIVGEWKRSILGQVGMSASRAASRDPKTRQFPSQSNRSRVIMTNLGCQSQGAYAYGHEHERPSLLTI